MGFVGETSAIFLLSQVGFVLSLMGLVLAFFFSSRRRHTILVSDWRSDVCSSDLAVYPQEGTLEADHPWLVLRAPWVDDTKREAAAGFLDYLRSEPVQARFQEAGFRTSEGRPGPQLSEANGLVPDQPARVLAPPAPKVVAAALESWNAARKRSNELAVYDVSGSMKQEVPGTG